MGSLGSLEQLAPDVVKGTGHTCEGGGGLRV